MTTERIDVLAVLDCAIEEYTSPRFTDRHGTGPELTKARAAVAELIEADKEYDAAEAAWDLIDSEKNGRRFDVAIERRRAALARVGAP